MVDGGIKVQMPISTRAYFRPQAASRECGNLPAPQSTHTEAPAAAAYVPADKRPGEQSQLPSALKINTQHSPFTFLLAKQPRLAAPVSNAAKRQILMLLRDRSYSQLAECCLPWENVTCRH